MRHPLDRILPIGTRSVLWGAHQFVLHPFYVNKAWKQLYKRPATLTDKVAFVVHDLGYFGKRTMDGPDGLAHPEWDARFMHRWFDKGKADLVWDGYSDDHFAPSRYWYNFCAGHSRHYAEHIGIDYSPLMRPDKLATHLYPRWLYGLLMWLSGEYKEYIEYWISKGDYPGTPNDNAWVYAGHLQSEWKRFDDLEGSIHGNNGSI